LSSSLKNLKKSKNRCFACGNANPHGLRLKFQYDSRNRCATAYLRLAARYQGATGFAHGGIIATLLDEAMAKANGMSGVRAVTVKMNVSYRKMVPLRKPLYLTGWSTLRKGRKLYLKSELRDSNDTLLAEATGLFLQV
jgi:acyl-coenzyme A thioesterase PaaI-like protein